MFSMSNKFVVLDYEFFLDAALFLQKGFGNTLQQTKICIKYNKYYIMEYNKHKTIINYML